MSTEVLNRLTRQEWNAAYFLGLEELFRGSSSCNVAEQIARGVVRLAAAGYSFEAPRGNLAVSSMPAVKASDLGEHQSACEEMTAGAFDSIGRAREALGWIAANLPAADTEWLEELLATYDWARSSPSRKASA